jgi:signal transduction histidine kinase
VEPAQYVHDVRSRLPRTYWLDALIVLLTITAVLELAFRRESPRAPETGVWFGVAALAIMVLPLFARRRFPFGAPAVYWLLAAGFSFLDGRLIPFVNSVYALGMTTAFLLGNVRDARRAWIGLAVVLGSAAIIVYNLPGHTASQLISVPAVFGASWFAGFAVRERAAQAEAAEVRAAQAERERDTVARIAVAEERTRIARELHDIVAHAVSVMVLQVGAVRHGLPAALAADRDALRGVEQVGRTALTEMRRLLAAMRLDGEDAELMPQPGLDNLRTLVDEIERAGLPVALQVGGRPVQLPRAVDLSAYRIAQEGLTNALKHSRATQAEVSLDYRPGELQIDVRDDGVGTATTDGLGHGLLGIRERVKIYGGEMAAGPAPHGGFVLTARLPIGATEP